MLVTAFSIGKHLQTLGQSCHSFMHVYSVSGCVSDTACGGTGKNPCPSGTSIPVRLTQILTLV